MANLKPNRTSPNISRVGRRSTFVTIQFKRIFSNNKRKILYEISGKVNFEGEDLFLNLKEFTCSGDREYEVKGKKAEERAKLLSLA